jgi:hypothetical protein
MLKVRQAT